MRPKIKALCKQLRLQRQELRYYTNLAESMYTDKARQSILAIAAECSKGLETKRKKLKKLLKEA